MESLLREVGLAQCIDAFNKEEVTPDIITMLSVNEFQELGISERGKMMELRILCSTFGPSQPVREPTNNKRCSKICHSKDYYFRPR